MAQSNIVFTDDERFYGIFAENRTCKTYSSIKILLTKDKRINLIDIAKHIKYSYSDSMCITNYSGNEISGIEYNGIFKQIKLFSQSNISTSQLVVNISDVIKLADIILSHLS